MSDARDLLRDQAVLRARAVELARVPVSTTAASNVELLEFRLGQERYAIEAHHARAIHPLRDFTPLPGTPAFITGIVNVRGRIVPLLDLKKFLALPAGGLTDLHEVILVSGADMELGLLADVGVTLRTLDAAELQRAPTTLDAIESTLLRGVTADRLIVIDINSLLSDPRIVVNDEVEL